VAFRGENLSASLYWLNNEKTVSKGILTSSVKSGERFHCSMIFGLMVSCFWANKPDEKPIISNIAIFRLISGKYRNYKENRDIACNVPTKHRIKNRS
jgi:hypothetical protein